tara:strand:+ start:99819 stop:100277 length:459 start_codon:yes stop_codon:yes gene_type:complete
MNTKTRAATDAACDLVLSSNDAARLEILAYEESTILRKLILDKLEKSELVSSDRLTPDIATIGSVLLYRIGAGKTERRTLSLPEVSYTNGQFINILTPIGIALLGRRAGSCFAVSVHDGSALKVQLLKVEFQPEAEARMRSRFLSETRLERC